MRQTRRRHPPLPPWERCPRCGEEFLALIHRPPVGWKETVLELFGLLK